MNRRDFIRSSLTATGTLIYFSCNPSKVYNLVRKNDILDNNEKCENNILYKILYYASLAPSGHNTQPWHIKVDDPLSFSLYSEPSRWLLAVDYTKRETLLSLGAFIENMSIASSFFGYDMEYSIVAKDGESPKVAEIHLVENDKKAYPIERLVTRRTIKSNFQNHDIRKYDIESLFERIPDCEYFSRQSKQGKEIDRLTLEANIQQVYRHDVQVELSEWIRWNKKEAFKYKDGITPAMMEIDGIANWFVRNFYKKEDVLKESFKKATVKKIKSMLDSYGGWIVITSQDSSPMSLIHSGRSYQKMGLRSKDSMIAIHPMTQVLEETNISDELHAELNIKQKIQFVLRVGYVKNYPSPVSLRRSVSSFVYKMTSI